MSPRSAVRLWVRTPLRVAGALLRLVLWYIPVSLAVGYSTVLVCAIVSVGTALCAILWYGRHGKPRPSAERCATLRLRRLGPGAWWVAGLAITAPLGIFALATLLTRWGYPLDQAPELFDPYIHRPGGWWSFGLMAVVFAPVIEEFTFRGWIQRPLERQLGAVSAIAISAALFGIVHSEPLRLPFLFLDGVVMGFVVYRTRSIWAGVAVHAGNNALATLTIVPPVAAALDGFGPPTTPEALAALLVLVPVVAFLLHGLLRATRRLGSPAGRAVPVRRLAPGNVPP